MTKTVTIGGAAGMWGDSRLATPQLLADGRCDYLVYEGLAEITMAILTKAYAKDPDHGYARDITEIIGDNLGACLESKTRIVTNAGGVNPDAAAAALSAVAVAAGLQVRIATVTGDDVTALMPDLPRGTISANAYLGARPIAAALDDGADVVITGRVVDSALTLGPLIHEFGWAPDRFDQLAGGSLAGHLLECGPQSTGGLLTDWRDTDSWADPGFPIAEVDADGSFTLAVSATGDGLVDTRTVAEQLVYEIGDPTSYLLPDVTCDWTAVRVQQQGPDRVRVTGALGRPPVPTLKVCAQVPDGYRVAVQYFVGGIDAAVKAQRAGEDLARRWQRLLEHLGHRPFRDVGVYAVGSETTYGPHARDTGVRESLMWVSAHHDDPAALRAAVREYPSIGLAGPPGMGGAAGGGLPKPSPVLRVDSLAVDRTLVAAIVRVDGALIDVRDVPADLCRPLGASGPDLPVPAPSNEAPSDTVTVPLIRLAHGRSGDKGSDVNIGVIARDPAHLPILARQLTAEAVADWLAHLGATRVQRFGLPGLGAVNFLLTGGLGTTGAASTRIDPQGKAIAQQLLDFPITVPRAALDPTHSIETKDQQ